MPPVTAASQMPIVATKADGGGTKSHNALAKCRRLLLQHRNSYRPAPPP
jgi:hypothetical protein